MTSVTDIHNYQEFAFAIIQTACEDYLDCLRFQRSIETDTTYIRTLLYQEASHAADLRIKNWNKWYVKSLNKCKLYLKRYNSMAQTANRGVRDGENFFKSDYFDILSQGKYDGQRMMEILKNRAENEKFDLKDNHHKMIYLGHIS